MGTKIKGIEGMSVKDIDVQLQGGAKFVAYMYCVSIVFMSFKRYSNIYFIMPGEKTIKKGIPFTLISLVFGWWGIPWGPIWTITAVGTNFTGGKDLTLEVAAQIRPQS